jgi:hypothetical protein
MQEDVQGLNIEVMQWKITEIGRELVFFQPISLQDPQSSNVPGFEHHYLLNIRV